MYDRFPSNTRNEEQEGKRKQILAAVSGALDNTTNTYHPDDERCWSIGESCRAYDFRICSVLNNSDSFISIIDQACVHAINVSESSFDYSSCYKKLPILAP